MGIICTNLSSRIHAFTIKLEQQSSKYVTSDKKQTHVAEFEYFTKIYKNLLKLSVEIQKRYQLVVVVDLLWIALNMFTTQISHDWQADLTQQNMGNLFFLVFHFLYLGISSHKKCSVPYFTYYLVLNLWVCSYCTSAKVVLFLVLESF